MYFDDSRAGKKKKQKLEVRNWMLKVGSESYEMKIKKLEVRDDKSEV